jgi:hypothetical protein
MCLCVSRKRSRECVRTRMQRGFHQEAPYLRHSGPGRHQPLFTPRHSTVVIMSRCEEGGASVLRGARRGGCVWERASLVDRGSRCKQARCRHPPHTQKRPAASGQHAHALGRNRDRGSRGRPTIAQHLDDNNEVALEPLHRALETASLCHAVLEIENVQFVGRRGNCKGNGRGQRDRSPLFLYSEFQGVEEAQAFGRLSDSTGFPAQFYSFWNTYFGERVEMWSCTMVILEALSLVSSIDKWSRMMELGQEKACPPSPCSLAAL